MSPPSAFTPHAAARLTKRGATEAEVVATSGPASPAPPSTTAPPSAAISRPRGVTKQNLRHETAGGLYCFRGRRLARHYRPREILLKAAMKLSYDPKANVAYIRLRERQGDVETISVTSDFLVDIDATGTVRGIERLNANEQLAAEDDGKLVFVNQLNGEEGELKVA